jgi:molybdopterin/thiamine biosynthesis adenylyltransferase
VAGKSILTEEEKLRYERQLWMKSIGEIGQNKLKSTSVLVVGAGGLGSPLLLYLTAAGIGRIGLVDYDTVSESNLNRQILYNTEDLGKSKALIAKSRLQKLNSNCIIESHPIRISEENGKNLFSSYDVVADATDNMKSRMILSDLAFSMQKPLFYGAVNNLSGVCTTFIPPETPCLRCIYPIEPGEAYAQKEKRFGILGATAGLISSMMALNIIKFFTGAGDYLKGYLFIADLGSNEFQKIKLTKKTGCLICNKK